MTQYRTYSAQSKAKTLASQRASVLYAFAGGMVAACTVLLFL